MTSLQRLPTGVPGLDDILAGGLLAGCSYIIQGLPGSGKTILANQIAFHHARTGGRVVFATLLAEPHDRLFQLLSTLEFFDREQVGTSMQFVSALDALEQDGLDGVVGLLRREIGRQGATLLVIDGLLNAAAHAESPFDTKRFVARLQSHAAFAGCTVLFITSSFMDATSPEHTMVDGVMELGSDLSASRSVRRLRLLKTRGSAALGGLHDVEIGSSGIVVHPRLEAVLPRQWHETHALTVGDQRISTGIDELDRMLAGGLGTGSTTLVMGPSGAGKTTLGLSFLSQATPDEPALLFGFYEQAGRLANKAASIGIDLRRLIDTGAVVVRWQHESEQLLDRLGHAMLSEVRQNGIRRVFVDSISAMARTAAAPGRVVSFFGALMSELQSREVTVLGSWEMRDLFGSDSQAPIPELSGIVDNILMLRLTELRSELRRVLSVLKARDSGYDPSLRELVIGADGVSMVRAFEQVASVLPGTAHPRPRV
ncbi:ATPase domain-containing protein [Rhizosaccharibacter radicis]|uniref:non-specific serine/threonine protein kinase n=1 Tax=Rhizosaccharibacter radicis TaxID=2782605 RepID=A0ABT1W171_9PROT|nr:AAA family ATPase [Acetobacteraceae bacterium KSS12]